MGTRRTVSKVQVVSGHFITGGLKIEASEVAQWAVVLATKPGELISGPRTQWVKGKKQTAKLCSLISTHIP